jgi:hypothetical protein
VSVPKITNAREYGEAIAELFALARPDGKGRVSDLLTGIVEYTQEDTKARLEVPAPAGMSRQEAVALAIQHVEKMATNARGYQDGNSLATKTQAVSTFVELLLGETSSSRE